MGARRRRWAAVARRTRWLWYLWCNLERRAVLQDKRLLQAVCLGGQIVLNVGKDHISRVFLEALPRDVFFVFFSKHSLVRRGTDSPPRSTPPFLAASTKTNNLVLVASTKNLNVFPAVRSRLSHVYPFVVFPDTRSFSDALRQDQPFTLRRNTG